MIIMPVTFAPLATDVMTAVITSDEAIDIDVPVASSLYLPPLICSITGPA